MGSGLAPQTAIALLDIETNCIHPLHCVAAPPHSLLPGCGGACSLTGIKNHGCNAAQAQAGRALATAYAEGARSAGLHAIGVTSPSVLYAGKGASHSLARAAPVCVC